MSYYIDHILELFQDEELRFFFVEKEDKGQLHIVDRNGKRNRVPESRIVFLFPNRTTSETATRIIDQLQEEISHLMLDIDTALLWESVPEYDREYKISELADIYFNTPSVIEQSALFHALRSDNLHFKRKGVFFFPRKQQQITEISLQAEKDQEKKEKTDRLLSFFKQILNSKNKLQPDEYFSSVLMEMKHRLYQHRLDFAEQILQSLDTRRSMGSLLYEVFHKTGIIREDENRFLIEAGIPELFSTETEVAAETASLFQSAQSRMNLTSLDIFSIDDESTREIDDALSIEKLENGFRIGIHISEVSSWIEPTSLLDKEAQKRISSIYLETGVITMFPEILSCDRMSLKSGEIRSALSLLVHCTPEGEITNYQFVISDFNVHRRLSYDDTDAMLKSKNTDLLSSQISQFKSLTDTWKKQRMDAGAIDICKPEFNLEVNGDDIVLKQYDRFSPSRSIVSECMILFNKLAAQFALERDIPMIYRAQDPPQDLLSNESRGRELKSLSMLNEKTLDRQSTDIDKNEYNPIQVDQIMRQMRPGRLTTIPLPHAGLGVDIYTQLSSPIRRYADLVLQRQIIASLNNTECPYKIEELYEILAAIEENEKQIREVYQRSRQYWLIRYLEKYRLHDVFPAMVINMNPRQAFVEILELGYRVALPGSPLFKIGQTLTIKVRKLDAEEGIMAFEAISVQ